MIATFGTEGTRSAILTACRGYRSEDYPMGIDVDVGQYLTSLIPAERGFLWPLADVLNGNEAKGRKPIDTFIREIKQYPGLLDIMLAIEGLVNKRSSHASGVIMFDEDPYEFGCFMKTPKGEVITQWDLHDCEYAGMTKYDFLLTEVQDKIVQTIELLKDDGVIEPELTLKEAYDKYLHPSVLPLDDEKVWKAIQNNEVLNIFQFDSDVGSQAAKNIRPSNILEMSDANGLMRLMTAEKGEETPMEKYIRHKENISLWYDEMKNWGLTEQEQKYLEPYFKSSYGVPPSQEQLMRMLMDEHICNFSLAEANNARKIVGKKQMSKIPALKEQVISKASRKELGEYIWKYGAGPQMGYSFSIIHALAYSFIGFQTAYLATRWNPIYWDTSCLIINSASLETEDNDYFDDAEYEDELVDKSTDYTKLAKAIGDITSRGIKVSLVDINESGYTFKPNIKNNEILFGLKGVNRVGADVINEIKANRPYYSFPDFLNKTHLTKTVVISLIKAGAFDKFAPNCKDDEEARRFIMAYFLTYQSKPKSKLNLQNFDGIVQRSLLPDDMVYYKYLYNFNKYLKKFVYCQYYRLIDVTEQFYNKHFSPDNLCVFDGHTMIDQKVWNKIYQDEMDVVRQWMKENQESLMREYNWLLFKEEWDKYASSSISAWEMESLCFYYHGHELAGVDLEKYGISNFQDLPETPEIEYFFKRGNNNIPIYKLTKIIGTVIGKNKTKSTVTLLTLYGVVTVKMSKDNFAKFGKRISEKQPDGKKKFIENSWFDRGIKLMFTGYRREDMFVCKTYKNTPTHQIYRIDDVNEFGEMTLVHERADSNDEI